MIRKEDTVSAPRKVSMGVVVFGSEEKTVMVSFFRFLEGSMTLLGVFGSFCRMAVAVDVLVSVEVVMMCGVF